MIAEITARHQINYQVQVVTILEGVVHIDQESSKIIFSLRPREEENLKRIMIAPLLLYLRMDELAEELLFIHD